MKSPARSPQPPAKFNPGKFSHVKQDRQSAAGPNGRNGAPKKGGAGGKGTWGSALDDAAAAYLDKNDPNYDSDGEDYPSGSPPGLELGSKGTPKA